MMSKTIDEKTALLAEGVLGWEALKDVNGWYLVSVGVRLAYIRENSTAYRWQPYTNLTHAGEVLDAMRGRGWEWVASSDRQTYGVEFFQPGNWNDRGQTDRSTLPAAICDAALLACGLVAEEEL